jgi:hypothetical protein
LSKKSLNIIYETLLLLPHFQINSSSVPLKSQCIGGKSVVGIVATIDFRDIDFNTLFSNMFLIA